MPRHAGFAAAASVRQATINDAIASYVFSHLGPYFIPMPQTIEVDGTPVTFAGVLELQCPTVELHANANDHIRVHYGLTSSLRARVGEGKTRKWSVKLEGTADLVPMVETRNDQIVVAIDSSQVVLHPLQVKVTKGSPILQKVKEALESPRLAHAVTRFVQGLPPVPITPPLLTTHLKHTEPLNTGWIRTDNWFTINLVVGRIVVKPLEKALTVAIDFQGFTSGDESQLKDLTKQRGNGSIYVNRIVQGQESDYGYEEWVDEHHREQQWVSIPLPERRREPAGGDISVAVNMDMMTAVVKRQVSPAIASVAAGTDAPWGDGTLINPDPTLVLLGVSLKHGKFSEATRPMQDGLELGFVIEVEEGTWWDMTGRLFVQTYLDEHHGSTEFMYNNPDRWRIYPAQIRLDVPWWLQAGIAAMTIYLSLDVPFLAPFLGLASISLLDGVIPDLIENAEEMGRHQVQSQMSALDFPTFWDRPLPGTRRPNWQGILHYVSVTPDGIDLAVYTYPDHNPLQDPKGIIGPDSWRATDTEPFETGLMLREDLLAVSQNIQVTWTVRRGDTNQVIKRETRSYHHHGGNGVTIDHHSKELYFVDSYKVSCVASLTVGDQVGEIWRGHQTVQIQDDLNRHFKYVQWGPHTVHFENEGTDGWWSHTRTSKIHRTAVSARCLMLRQRESPMFNAHYKNHLGFPQAELNYHRKPLCEYCFFGGPDKSTPLPEHDWF